MFLSPARPSFFPRQNANSVGILADDGGRAVARGWCLAEADSEEAPSSAASQLRKGMCRREPGKKGNTRGKKAKRTRNHHEEDSR